MPYHKKGTYLVEYWNGNKYVFGNNYKSWYQHAIELAIERWRDVPDHQMFKSVKYSRVRFVDDGGLKYCAAEHYQQIIDDVSAKYEKPLKPFSEYDFQYAPRELALLDKELARW